MSTQTSKRSITATGIVAASCFVFAVPLGIVGLFFLPLLIPAAFLFNPRLSPPVKDNHLYG